MKREGRGFLVIQSIILFIAALAMLGDAGGQFWSGAFDNAVLAPGALWQMGIVAGAGLAFAIWSIARPASSATAVAWAGAVFALPALVMPLVWRDPPPQSGSLAAMENAHGIHAVRTASVGTLALAFGAMALGFAAVAAARRARRNAPPKLSWRALAVGLAGTFAYAAVTTWVRTGPSNHETFFVVVPGALSILALTAAATARKAPDTSDVWMGIVLSFGAMALAWSSAYVSWVGSVDLSGMTFRPEVSAELGRELQAAGRRALPVFGPWLFGALLAAPDSWSRAVMARAAAPIAAGLLVAATSVTFMRTAIARALHVVDQWEWPELAKSIPDDEDCGEVPPHAIVWARNGSVRLPNGDAYKAPFDWAGIAANIDAVDSSADVWLAVDPEKGTWGDVGGLVDAVGRRRAPRGIGLTSDEPLEGCAIRLVGRWKDAVACSGPIGIAIDGCTPGPTDEKHWHVRVDGSEIEMRWLVGTTVIMTRRGLLAQLAELTMSEWNVGGSHRDPSDPRYDHATLELPAGMPMRAALEILGTIRQATRMVNQPQPARSHPVFVVSLALSAR